jgi:pyridoxine 5-phosphate synthase
MRHIMADFPPLRLGLNIDHVATVRNARGGAVPDPVRAALMAVEHGIDGITAHLREDRRHIRDEDMVRLGLELKKPLNFEMAATEEMKKIALQVKPHAVCLVPEKREERTTEGGLDIVGQQAVLKPYIAELVQAGIRVSLFIEADEAPIAMAKVLGAPVIELHTGSYCDALAHGDQAKAAHEFDRLDQGAALAGRLGLEVHAGHGLDFYSAEQVATIPEIRELNIGHFLIGEAIFVGLPTALEEMRAAMARGRARARPRS